MSPVGVAGSRAGGAAGSHREPPRRWGRPFGTDAAEMADAAIDAAALDEFEAELDAAATAEASAHDIVPFEAESDADEASAIDIVPFEEESDAEASAHDIVPFEAESDADEASAIDIVPFEAESDAAAGAARPGRLQLDLDPLPDISATLSGTMEW